MAGSKVRTVSRIIRRYRFKIIKATSMRMVALMILGQRLKVSRSKVHLIQHPIIVGGVEIKLVEVTVGIYRV
jgi:hypothetical protein